jgi:molecular chaperone GrpE
MNDDSENSGTPGKAKSGGAPGKGKLWTPEPPAAEEAVSAAGTVGRPAGGEAEQESSRRNAQLTDQLMRLQAEFDNYRKRMVKEQTRILETAESELIRKLLPILDNLERAIEHAPASDGLTEGVQMVLDQLLAVLEKEGLEVVDPGGEPFDPEHHEAMMVVETDECPEDTVVEVVQKGYRFNGLLLRPAMVKVSCAVKA